MRLYKIEFNTKSPVNNIFNINNIKAYSLCSSDELGDISLDFIKECGWSNNLGNYIYIDINFRTFNSGYAIAKIFEYIKTIESREKKLNELI